MLHRWTLMPDLFSVHGAWSQTYRPRGSCAISSSPSLVCQGLSVLSQKARAKGVQNRETGGNESSLGKGNCDKLKEWRKYQHKQKEGEQAAGE